MRNNPDHAGDFFRTPEHAIAPLFDYYPGSGALPTAIIDAGCGDGAISCAMSRLLVGIPVAIHGLDINPVLVSDSVANSCDQSKGRLSFSCTDFLRFCPDRHIDLIVSNPPFGPVSDRLLCEKFIRHSMSIRDDRTVVAMLLRASYLVPKVRKPLRDEFGLPDKIMLSRRPSFSGGGTDATEYAWHVWHHGQSGRYVIA